MRRSDIVMNKHIIGERRIEFDENGDRTAADYLILNMAESGLIETVGEYKVSWHFFVVGKIHKPRSY